MRRIAELITDVPDFPEPGVTFRDITPLIGDSDGLAAGVEALLQVSPTDVDYVLGIEARGFIFAAPVALALRAGLVPVRKPAKLPRRTVSITYGLEYGTETLAVHVDAVPPGARVLIVDDVLATGGTAIAAAELVRRLDAQLLGVSVLIELDYLAGRQRLREAGIDPVTSVLTLSAS
jgi:adenine phosphoribosyltransferase